MTTDAETGSDVLEGPRQIYSPKPLIIGSNSGSGVRIGDRTNLRVPVPSSQCRVKLSVIFVPRNGNNVSNIATTQQIWVSAQEQDQKGIAGGGGGFYDVNDLEGTAVAPLAFPTTAGLQGYSREFVTAADAIGVQLTMSSVPGGAAFAGIWVAQFRIEPFAIAFPWQAWQQIRALFDPTNLGPRLNL